MGVESWEGEILKSLEPLKTPITPLLGQVSWTPSFNFPLSFPCYTDMQINVLRFSASVSNPAAVLFLGFILLLGGG